MSEDGSKAYGRLWGKLISNTGNLSPEAEEELASAQSIDLLVKELPLTLGRAESGPSHLNINVGSVDGKNNTISRQHMLLLYDEAVGAFKIQCLSKNGVDIRGQRVAKDGFAELKAKTSIRAGNAFMYWLPAKDTKDTKAKTVVSWGRLVSDALQEDAVMRELCRDSTKGVSVRMVKDWVLKNRPSFCEGGSKTHSNMQSGVYATFSSKAASNPYGRIDHAGSKDVTFFIKPTASGRLASEVETTSKGPVQPPKKRAKSGTLAKPAASMDLTKE